MILDASKPEAASTIGTDLAATTGALAHRLRDTTITTVPDLELAVSDRQQIGEAIKSVQSFFEPFKSMAYKLHRAICDRENAILKPLTALDAEKSQAIGAFKREQDRIRAEREREEAEAQRRAREAEAAAEAAALEAAGDHDMAAAVMEQAIAEPPPVVALPDVTKQVEGLSFTKRWKWRYAGGPADVKQTPPHVLARSLAMMPREFLMPDETRIGAYARSMKQSGKIPGIEIYSVDIPTR